VKGDRKPDPYCELLFEGQRWKSEAVKDSKNPHWNENTEFTLRSKESKLMVRVWDFNKDRDPEYVGHVLFSVDKIASMNVGVIEKSLSLRKANKKKSRGVIRFKVQWEERPVFRIPEPKVSKLFSSEMEVSDKNATPDLIYKLIILGDSGVGKTQYTSQWLTGSPIETKATISLSLASKAFQINGKVVKVQFWDTAGQEQFRSLTRQYYRGSMGVILMYSVIDRESFDSIPKWLDDLYSNIDDDTKVILVGNKSDQEDQRQVSKEEGYNLAQEKGLPFLETSSYTGKNSQKSMQLILQLVHEIQSKKPQPVKEVAPPVVLARKESVKLLSTDSTSTKKEEVVEEAKSDDCAC